MTSSRYFPRTNAASRDHMSTYAESNISQINDHFAASIENQDLNRRMKTLEETVNNRKSKENIKIQQLQDQLEKLKEQFIQYSTKVNRWEEQIMSKSDVQF